MLSEEEVQAYLDDNGYPAHLVAGGLPGLLKRYAAFVQEVESGYPHRLHDYRHDLDIRAILRMAGHDEDLAELDNRFRAVLVESAGRVWESACHDPWWDFGVPRNAPAQLRRGFLAEGLLSESSPFADS